MKRPDLWSGLLWSWSGPVMVFFWSRDRTSKHYMQTNSHHNVMWVLDSNWQHAMTSENCRICILLWIYVGFDWCVHNYLCIIICLTTPAICNDTRADNMMMYRQYWGTGHWIRNEGWTIRETIFWFGLLFFVLLLKKDVNLFPKNKLFTFP